MAVGSVRPQLAPVRPRVIIEDDRIPEWLDDLVREHLSSNKVCTLWILGPGLGGKTTALRHLAAVFADDPRVALADGHEALRSPMFEASGTMVVVVAAVRSPQGPGTLAYRLAPWDDDDCLAYLVHHRREAATHAFSRWRATDTTHDLREWPMPCSAVLETLAEYGDVPDLFAAIDVAIATRSGPEVLDRLRHLAVMRYRKRSGAKANFANDEIAAWLASASIRARLVAEFLTQAIEHGTAFELHRLRMAPPLLDACSHMLRADPDRIARCLHRARSVQSNELAWWLAILNATLPDFRPPLAELHELGDTYLPGIDVSGMTLHGRFRHCVLRHAHMHHTDLRKVCAIGADLRGIRGNEMIADDAVFRDANLSSACLSWGWLRNADLRSARMESVSLRGAVLSGADLRGASLDGADLRECVAVGTNFRRLDLRNVLFDDGCFDRACFEGARLEQVSLEGVRAEWANFREADLTATKCHRARLRGASLVWSRLALLDAEGADLRDADLRYATFQFGSSRSGLLHSALASEGTRTGFYTDEALEDSFLVPEEVRKANLRYADLRGARIDGTDFYLVDLRGALLDEHQLAWLRQCKAILDRAL